jgi:F-type H+-transporting ATPase subunit a
MFLLNSPLEQFEILRFFDIITNHSTESVMNPSILIDIATMAEIETILHEQGLWPAQLETTSITFPSVHLTDCEFNDFFSLYFPLALKTSLLGKFYLLNEQLIFLQFFFEYCYETSVMWFDLDAFEGLSSWCICMYKNILYPINIAYLETSGFDSFLVGFDLLDLNPFDDCFYTVFEVLFFSILKAHFLYTEVDADVQIGLLYVEYLDNLEALKMRYEDHFFFFFLFEKWANLRLLDQQFVEHEQAILMLLQNGFSTNEEMNFDVSASVSIYLGKSAVLIANNLLVTVFFFSFVYIILFNTVFVQTFLISHYQHIILFSFISVIKTFINDLLISKVSKIYYYHLFLCLFICLLFLNVFGLIPYTFVLTAQFCFTFLCSFLYFFALNLTGIRLHGFKLLGLFFPTGAPIFIAPLLVIIEFISYFARVFSLAIRLFANITAGHILLKIIAWFNWSLLQVIFVGILGNIIILILWFLEFFISVLQAYVFIILLCIYLNDVINLH